MNNYQQRKQDYGRAVDRALDWAVSHQEVDGGFGAVETMSHYMALGASLLYGGRTESAARLMPFLEKTFVKPGGGFDAPEIRSGRKTSLLERAYAPSWMIYSGHLNLAYGISLPSMPELLRFQDPQTGGMFGTIEDAERGAGIIHPAVTSVACQAALTTGFMTEARRMADHLIRVVEQNPDLSRAFYPVWDTVRGLRTDAETPVAPNMPAVLWRDQPAQHHFLSGMMIAVLVDLYRVVREQKYLDAAITIYEFADGGTDAIYQTTASHKFAWGCAWLYRQTGDPRHLESACRICDYLVNHQESDGSFVHWAFVKSADEWPYSPRLNITGQFALWICRTMQLL